MAINEAWVKSHRILGQIAMSSVIGINRLGPASNTFRTNGSQIEGLTQDEKEHPAVQPEHLADDEDMESVDYQQVDDNGNLENGKCNRTLV